jgi:hypothetical protein
MVPVSAQRRNSGEGKRRVEEVEGWWLFEGAEGGEPMEEQSSGATRDARRWCGSARGRG